MIDETAQQIYKRLDGHSERLNKIEDIVRDISSTNRTIAEYTEKSNKNYNYLFGNGEPGLDERVRNLEKKMNDFGNAVRWLAVVAGGYLVVEIVKFILVSI